MRRTANIPPPYCQEHLPPALPEFFHQSCNFRPTLDKLVPLLLPTLTLHPVRVSSLLLLPGFRTRIAPPQPSLKSMLTKPTNSKSLHQRHSRHATQCTQRFYTMPQQHSPPLLSPFFSYDAHQHLQNTLPHTLPFRYCRFRPTPAQLLSACSNTNAGADTR